MLYIYANYKTCFVLVKEDLTDVSHCELDNIFSDVLLIVLNATTKGYDHLTSKLR